MTVRPIAHINPPGDIRDIGDVQQYLVASHEGLNRIRRGRIECVTEVTLTANASSTVLYDRRLSPQTFLGFDPRTANAAAELAAGTMYVTDANRTTKGQVTITHANNAQTDRTFFVSILG